MGFLCKNRENESNVTISDVIDEQLNRDLGLSNIYNVNTITNFCFEGFNGPGLDMSGATKPTTGMTISCTGTPTTCYSVYNLSEVDDFSLLFNLTGSTDYTGYTGSFCYNMFGRGSYYISDPLGIENTKLLNNVNPVRSKCFDFSGLTSSTIVDVFSITDIPILDDDYMIRPYYIFDTKECSIGQTYNTWNTTNQFNGFDYDTDWYFITTTSPSTPQLIGPQEDPLDTIALRQQSFTSNGFATDIPLNENPIGSEVMLFVNGVALTKGRDFVLDYELYPRIPPILRLIRGSFKTTDVIKLVYLVGPNSVKQVNNGQQNQELFTIDSFVVTGFTSGLTASSVNIVNLNTTVTSPSQEIYLTSDFSEGDTIIMFINGVSLIEGVEFFRSRTSNNRLIMNPSITQIDIGDAISIWYFKPHNTFNGNLGALIHDFVDIKWTITPFVQPSFNTGKFIVEVKEEADDWTTLFVSGSTDYISTVTDYNLVISGLDLRKVYNYRVVFEKTYASSLSNNVLTRSYSDEGIFNTNRDELYYSY